MNINSVKGLTLCFPPTVLLFKEHYAESRSLTVGSLWAFSVRKHSLSPRRVKVSGSSPSQHSTVTASQAHSNSQLIYNNPSNACCFCCFFFPSLRWRIYQPVISTGHLDLLAETGPAASENSFYS